MREQERSSVAVVTGSSSGIGLEASLLLARNEFRTYATVHNLHGAQQLLDIIKKEKENEMHKPTLDVLPLDVTDDNSVKSAIDKIVNEAGRIDVLVNNAGYGLIGALEDIPMDEVKAHFETNLFGPIRVMQDVLPIMRKQGSGIIVNISSMGGRIAFPLSSTYSGTKFALEAISDSLSYEVEQFGIKIIVIEPGVVKTNFGKSMKKIEKTMNPDSPYAKLAEVRESTRKERVRNSSVTPDEVAKVILQAVTSSNPNARYVVGNDASGLLEAKNKMTDSEFRDLMMSNFFGKAKNSQ
jgi:NAD(P)-dependent dehydrogenase (short-subunit alcohol dehydrogenase family)